jgi:sodium--glutamate symport carrier gltS
VTAFTVAHSITLAAATLGFVNVPGPPVEVAIALSIVLVLNQRLAALRKYNIPEPVTAGLLFSAAFGLVYLFSGVKVDFELTARDILLVYFFTVIGINAQVSDLVRGGKPLGVLLAVTVAFMFAENLVSIGAARILGLDPSVGLLAASISMTGHPLSPRRAGSQTQWRSGSSARPWGSSWPVSPGARSPAS